jgi:hypothetical protein
MTLKWIAGELYMGAWTRVSNLLSQALGRSNGKKEKGVSPGYLRKGVSPEWRLDKVMNFCGICFGAQVQSSNDVAGRIAPKVLLPGSEVKGSGNDTLCQK